MVYHWLVSTLQCLYPPACLLCGAAGHRGMDLCLGCRRDLPGNGNPCRRCALPLPLGVGADPLCGHCHGETPVFDHCYAALRYEGAVGHLVGRLKFDGKLAYGRLLSRLLRDYLETRDAPMPELLLPVPLHPYRLRQRGFNQALELAQPLGRHFHIPVDVRACARTRATRPQAELELAKRRGNLRGAFAVSKALSARHVAIVDDVVTTGSTVSALTRVLLRHGVHRVDVWALARTGQVR